MLRDSPFNITFHRLYNLWSVGSCSWVGTTGKQSRGRICCKTVPLTSSRIGCIICGQWESCAFVGMNGEQSRGRICCETVPLRSPRIDCNLLPACCRCGRMPQKIFSTRSSAKVSWSQLILYEKGNMSSSQKVTKRVFVKHVLDGHWSDPSWERFLVLFFEDDMLRKICYIAGQGIWAPENTIFEPK
jgi:hypothetical protein